MGDPALNLSIADQALANLAFALIVVREDEPDWKMLADCVAELRGQVNPEHPFSGRLLMAVEGRLAVADMPPPNRGERSLAAAALAEAVRTFAMWRAGAALDVLRAGNRPGP
jgi:hypothetical protein